MESLTIRVTRATHDLLKSIQAATHKPITQIVEDAVNELDKKRFWEQCHASYAALAADPTAREEFQRELSEWDATLADGLED
jgi:hypothetical protein